MKIVTSIGMNRLPRQKKCITSWLKLGVEVESIQSVGEAQELQPLFPEVTFVETELVGDMFDKPHLVRAKALFNRAKKENVLVINSDIEIRCNKDTFLSKWSSPQHDEFKVGIRWNEDPMMKTLELLKWGIDAFLITPEINAIVPDIGMTIGCPAWDYWIIIYLNVTHGYNLTVNKDQDLIHEIHQQNWSSDDYRTGLRILEQHTGMGRQESGQFIRKITGR